MQRMQHPLSAHQSHRGGVFCCKSCALLVLHGWIKKVGLKSKEALSTTASTTLIGVATGPAPTSGHIS